MYSIKKEFSFAASHMLEGLSKEHPCSRLHGHNYIIEVELRRDYLDDKGFVVDYRDLQPIKDFIDKHYDHNHLNHFLEFNPTAENIARHLYGVFKLKFPDLFSITVKETPKTAATYYE